MSVRRVVPAATLSLFAFSAIGCAAESTDGADHDPTEVAGTIGDERAVDVEDQDRGLVRRQCGARPVASGRHEGRQRQRGRAGPA